MVCTPLGRFPNYCPQCRLCCIRCMQHPKLNSKLRKWGFGPWCRKPKRLAYCCQPLRLCWQRRHHTSDFSDRKYATPQVELEAKKVGIRAVVPKTEAPRLLLPTIETVLAAASPY